MPPVKPLCHPARSPSSHARDGTRRFFLSTNEVSASSIEKSDRGFPADDDDDAENSFLSTNEVSASSIEKIGQRFPCTADDDDSDDNNDTADAENSSARGRKDDDDDDDPPTAFLGLFAPLIPTFISFLSHAYLCYCCFFRGDTGFNMSKASVCTLPTILASTVAIKLPPPTKPHSSYVTII
jgi:hypothetical protein